MLSEILRGSTIAQTVSRGLALLALALLLCVIFTKSLFARLALKVSGQLPKGSDSLHVIKDLPGVPFRFPNGQGTEKFFDGRRASRRWRKQHGPIYSIWSGFKREVIISKPEHVQEFYKDSHTHIKATDNNSGWLFAELLGSCVGVVSQQRWKRVRRPFESHFTRSMAIKRPRLFICEAKEFFRALNPGGTERIINTANDLKYCPFFMVASIFFGLLSADQRKGLRALGPSREELFKDAFMGGINRFSIAKYLPGSAMPRLRAFQESWESLVRKAHQDSIRKGNGAIVSLWEEMENGQISMRELLQTLDESLFANLDVTAHAVSWNAIRIAQHIDIQQKVREELRVHVHPSSSEGSYEDYICRDDTLLAACVLETSRLHPILPFSNPEAADEDKIIDDYIIPRKTDVIVDAYAINVDNPYWENATIFDPYRHLGQKDQTRRYNMWRFGFGPRQCLGKNVADIILRTIMAELLKGYELETVQEGGIEGVELQADSWIGLPNGMVKMTPIKV